MSILYMLHQIPESGNEIVVAAIVNTALSHIDKKFNIEMEKIKYEKRKIHP